VSDATGDRAGAKRRRFVPRSASNGAFLIEALVAILVFSMSAAGVFTLLANAVRASGNGLARITATDLAAATLARMSAEDPVTLVERYASTIPGPGFRSLVGAARQLPGVTDAINAPTVSIAPGPSANSRRVSVTIYWQLPSDGILHRTVMTSVVAAQ
jgi:hypothetical protein